MFEHGTSRNKHLNISNIMVKVFTTQRKLFLGPFAVILALPQMILLFPHVRIAIKTKVETRLNRQLRKIPITGIASPKFHPCCHRPGGLALLNLVHQVAQQDAERQKFIVEKDTHILGCEKWWLFFWVNGCYIYK